MLNRLRSSFGLISILILAACSGGGGGGNGDGGGSPKDREQALNKLSATHRATFEAWQKKVVKSCDASQAFGLHREGQTEEGVDGAALISRNHGSMVFANGESLVILNEYTSFSGVGSSKAEETSVIDGQSYSITAETKREGSSCVVYLYGQKVYETSVYQSFTVGLQYKPNVQASTTSANPIIHALGSNGSAEVVQHGLFSLLTESLKPSREAQTLIGQNLGLNADQAAKFFQLGETSIRQSIVKINGDSNSAWTSIESGNLIGSKSVLENYFDGGNRTIPLEVRLKIPQYEIGEVTNTNDNGNLKLILSAQISKNSNGFGYTLNSLQNKGLTQFSDDEAIACAGDRLSAYLGTGSATLVSPSKDMVMGPCSILSPKVEDVAFRNGFLKSALPVVLSGILPSTRTEYSGWDYVLSKFAKDALNANKDIMAELDPSSHTKVIHLVAWHLTTLKSEIDQSNNMSTLKDAVLGMGLTWSYQGQNVSIERMGQIIQSLDNATDVFPVSSSRLLNALANNPHSYEEQLSFASNIDNTYKSEAQKALRLSRDLSYSDFESEIFNEIIQRKVSIDELKDWSSKFSTIKNKINNYGNLRSVKNEVIGLSIKWLKSGEVAPQDLGGIYAALNNSADPFVESTKQLVRDLAQSFGANREALEFARNLSPEYKKLAQAIKNNSAAVEYESWGVSFFNHVLQERPSINQVQQWNELWSATLGFIQREKARVAGDFSSIPEWNRKAVVEVAVNEVWSGKEFLGLETISQIAKSKITCDHYKDASSLADCAGMSLFSKGQKKFFDPLYAGRYTSLGSDFSNYMNRLSDSEWIMIRQNLLDAFFGGSEPIWSNCDASSFSQKAKNLKLQINAIVVESDQFKKWEIERQIGETVKNCQ